MTKLSKSTALAICMLAATLAVPAVAIGAVVTHVEANVSGYLGEEKTGGPSISISFVKPEGSASAVVDLPRGILRATAAGTADPAGAASSTATFTDVVTITGPLAGPLFATVSLHIKGQIVPDLLGPTPAHTVGAAVLDVIVDGLGGQTGGIVFQPSCFGVGVPCIEGTEVDFIFPRTVTITPEHRILTIVATLQANANVGGQAKFGDTAFLSIDLPAGLAFTSESGVLLTAVPEPETWALMIAGLLALGYHAQRRRARTAI